MEEAKPRVEILSGYGLHLVFVIFKRSAWEGAPKNVRVVYLKRRTSEQYPEYRGAREIPWEGGGTTLQA